MSIFFSPNIGTGLPSTQSQSIFTGATVPLTAKDNNISYENNYEYKSLTHNITITGLTGRATITNNGSKNVTVAFDVTSATNSLKFFDITCVNGTQSITYRGLHAHYGTTLTGTQNLTFAFLNVTKDGTEGTVGTATTGTNYRFIVSTSLPTFVSSTALYNNIYAYQVLNVLIGRATSLSSSSILGSCISFNQPLTLPTPTLPTLGSSFLTNASQFNQPLTLPSNITSIGTFFLANTSFNQPLTIPSNITTITNGFLQSTQFNQPLTFPSGITSIGDSFLSGTQFNRPLTLPSSLTSIGNAFLISSAFNQPLTLPSSLTSVGSQFLRNSAFNQPLTIPSNLTTIGNQFLEGTPFNQPLTIPSTVTSIGTSFLYQMQNLSTVIYEATPIPTDNNSLSQTTNSKTSASGAGIIVYGSRRAAVLTALPDRTATPFRKLINGGS